MSQEKKTQPLSAFLLRYASMKAPSQKNIVRMKFKRELIEHLSTNGVESTRSVVTSPIRHSPKKVSVRFCPG